MGFQSSVRQAHLNNQKIQLHTVSTPIRPIPPNPCSSLHLGFNNYIQENTPAQIIPNEKLPTNPTLFFSAGNRGHITVTVRSYHPIVRCLPTPPFLDHGTCVQTLDILPASPYKILFDRKPTHSFPSDIPPEGLVFRDGQYFCPCYLFLPSPIFFLRTTSSSSPHVLYSSSAPLTLLFES